MKRLCRRPQLAAVLAVGLIAALASSCGPRRQAIHPVRGKVLFGNQPTPGAIVVFHPVGSDDPKAHRPSGLVRDDGSFSLTTVRPEDGAPEGEYDVAIVWLAEGERDPATGEVPSRLPPHYGDPRTSKLRATVQKGPNDLPPFELPR